MSSPFDTIYNTRSQIEAVANRTDGLYGMGGSGTPSYLEKDKKGEYTISKTDPNGTQRWDCSGFVGHCVGADFGSRYFATPEQGNWLSAHGFRDVKTKVTLSNGAGMRRGDILVYNKKGTNGAFANGHTEIYWGNGRTLGARGGNGHPVGINTGGTTSVSRSDPWQQCWRPKSLAIILWTKDKG